MTTDMWFFRESGFFDMKMRPSWIMQIRFFFEGGQDCQTARPPLRLGFNRPGLCPKSLTTTPFYSAVRMSSGEYYTLYCALKVSHNALQKVVYNRWSLTKQYLPSCIAGRMHGSFNSRSIQCPKVRFSFCRWAHYKVHYVGFKKSCSVSGRVFFLDVFFFFFK